MKNFHWNSKKSKNVVIEDNLLVYNIMCSYNRAEFVVQFI